MIKNYLMAILLCLGFAQVQQAAHARQIAGGDMAYRCLGNNQYAITLRLYRDCNGGSLDSVYIGARCTAGSSLVYQPKLISVKDITGIGPNCPDTNKCGGGSYTYGYEEHIYLDTIDVSSLNCCEVEVYFQSCCRSSNITTGSANQGFYINAMLNKCISPCNSSPVFTTPSAALYCVNQDLVYNTGAIDTVDQCDSVSYSFVKGLRSVGNFISYSGQFSEFRTFTFLGFPNQNLNLPAGFRLETVTGNLLFRPTKQNEIGTTVIEVQEWRRINGIMQVVGRTRKDLQIAVIPCSINRRPSIKPPHSVLACAGEEVCIDINTEDENQADTVSISWNEGIPGAKFTNNNGQVKHATGKVCWTPTEKDICNTPYSFVITAKDNACPVAGQSIRVFQIFVGLKPQAERRIDTLGCGKLAVSYTMDSLTKGLPGLRTEWLLTDERGKKRAYSNKVSDTISGMGGLNILKLRIITNSSCIIEYCDTFKFAHLPVLGIVNDTVPCAKTPIELKAFVQNGFPPYSFRWSTSLKDTNSSVFVVPLKDSSFWLEIGDLSRCTFRDSVHVKMLPIPAINLGGIRNICEGAILNLAVSAGHDSYLWSNGSRASSTSFNKTDSIWVWVKGKNGCENSDTAYVKTNPHPIVNLGIDRLKCAGETIQVFPADTSHHLKFRWNDGDIRKQKGISIPGKYWLEVQDTIGCKGRDTIEISDYQPKYYKSSDTAALHGDTIKLSVQGANQVFWREAINPQTIIHAGSDYIFKAEKPGQLLLNIRNDSAGLSCYTNDTIRFFVNYHPEIFSDDRAIVCENGEVCISLRSFDKNQNDTVFFSLVNAPLGANLEVIKAGEKHPYARVCYKAPIIRNFDSLVQITVAIRDNGVPPSLSNTKNLIVRVVKPQQQVMTIRETECYRFEVNWQVLPLPLSVPFRSVLYLKDKAGYTFRTFYNNPVELILPRADNLVTLYTISDAGCITETHMPVITQCIEDIMLSSKSISNSIQIFPNPAHQEFYIEIPGFVCDAENLKLLDFSGRPLSIAIEQNDAGKFMVKSSELAAGVYLVQATCDGMLYQAKVVVGR